MKDRFDTGVVVGRVIVGLVKTKIGRIIDCRNYLPK